MHITVNGKEHDLDEAVTVAELLKYFELKPTKIAVERNLEIIPKSAFDSVKIEDGDKFEIVQFVGGG